MEPDDDDFGVLYTDNLRTSSSSSAAPIPPPVFSFPQNTLNTTIEDEEDDQHHHSLYKNPSLPSQPNHELQDHPPKSSSLSPHQTLAAEPAEENQSWGFKIPEMEAGIGFFDEEYDPAIPGLWTGGGVLIPGLFDAYNGGGVKEMNGGGAEDNWGSDENEDDLKIILDDTDLPVGAGEEEDDDEDGEVADSDNPHPGGETEWGEEDARGEEAARGVVEAERKEAEEVAQGAVMMAGAPGARIGYDSQAYHPHNQAYHPHLSQFKYVRPDASIMPAGVIVDGGAPSQVRPPLTMGSIIGRGRGDWRPIGTDKSAPILPKNFHSLGRSFGNGMEFTLPSHKTIFDVNIDNFERKPWRYPGVDISDYFNFGLDEDTWKDYCKQLGQFRLEATMQHNIHVYESGRSEQEYDPDLPPELAAAVGLHDVAVENAHFGKADSGQMDLTGLGREATCRRPQLPTGRAIQVESGYGERRPSMDTRQPRLRDSDAIIEIVLQDSIDDNSISATANVALQRRQVDLEGCDHDFENDNRQTDGGYFDQFPRTYNDKKREMVTSSKHNSGHEGDGILPFPSEVPIQYCPNSKVQTPMYPSKLSDTPHEGRQLQGTGREKYSDVSGEHANDVIPNQSAQNKSDVSQKEKSNAGIEGKWISEPYVPVAVEAAKEQSTEQTDDMHDDVLAPADSFEGEEIALDLVGGSSLHQSVEKQKPSSPVEQPAFQDFGSSNDLQTTQSDDSKSKSGSNRVFHSHHDGGEEEVVQDARSRRMEEPKRPHDEDEYSHRRRDECGWDNKEIDRIHVVVKGREDLYHSHIHRNWDSSPTHCTRAKSESFERPKERDSSVGLFQRRDDDTHIRRAKEEESRRRERIEEIGSRHRSKLHENERIDRDEHLLLKKRVDDGVRRTRYHKDDGLGQRKREDVLLSRRVNVDDVHERRRKDEELWKIKHGDREDILHGYSSRRKRERADGPDQRRREDQSRAKDKFDDHHSIRHREESWWHREREDRLRPKQSHEDKQANRDKEDGRGSVKRGRVLEDRQWGGNASAKDEPKGLGSDKDYQHKDKRQHSELPKRRDQVEEKTSSQHRFHDDIDARENRFKEDRNARHDRSSTQNDRSINARDSQWFKDRHKARGKESEGGDHNTQFPSKHKQGVQSAHRDEKVIIKGVGKKESSTAGYTDSHDHRKLRLSSAIFSKKDDHHNAHEKQHEASQHHHSSRKNEEYAVSENDRKQQKSRRGHSKSECWTSHKGRESATNAPMPTSYTEKETERSNDKPLAGRQPKELAKKGGDPNPSSGTEIIGDLEAKDVDVVVTSENQYVDPGSIGVEHHLDTFERLKKRSERFKLPMPNDKETSAKRKLEHNETLLTQMETTTADMEIKLERPPRKRRWSDA